MGADLILAVLEIPHDVDPNFGAAKDKLDNFTKDDLLKLGVVLMQVSLFPDDDVFTAKDVKDVLSGAVEEVKACWMGDRRLATRLKLHSTTALIAGDSSWGDPVEECDAIAIFADSGLAHEAGFLDCEELDLNQEHLNLALEEMKEQEKDNA